MAYTTRKFYETNPRPAKAVVGAIDEASGFIARDRRAAARIYRELATVKASEEELLRILDDPDSRYSIVPDGVMTYAEFMHRAGTIRTKPVSWKELFIPELHERPGS